MRIGRLTASSPLQEARVLFISGSEKDRVPKLLQAVQGACVLTISETDQFAQHGGMVNLVMRDELVRFEVNVAATARAGLRLSSKALKYAIIVVREPGKEVGLR